MDDLGSPGSQAPIRVLVADDHPFVRRGVRGVLEESGVRVVAEAEHGDEALRLLRELKGAVDVVVTDLSMPGTGGLEIIGRMRAEQPGLPIIVLSMHPAESVALQALEAGAVGFLSKSDAPEHTARAVLRVAQGKRYLTPEVAELAVAREQQIEVALSVRELQVVRAVAAGKRRPEIAAALGLSPNTVSVYKSRAMAKLGVTSDTELARVGLRVESEQIWALTTEAELLALTPQRAELDPARPLHVEAVPPVPVHVLEPRRRQPREILVPHLAPFRSQRLGDGLGVARVPHHDRVRH
jgi:DNA-binding NarL/FixJ family response regulator